LKVFKELYVQPPKLWEQWETRSVFGGEFSKPGGNDGKTAF
jgi:hypothetical protein